jgi:hypothetical protein
MPKATLVRILGRSPQKMGSRIDQPESIDGNYQFYLRGNCSLSPKFQLETGSPAVLIPDLSRDLSAKTTATASVSITAWTEVN